MNKFILDPYNLVNKISDKTLEKYINIFSDNYYNNTNPDIDISDDIFDFLVDELNKRNPNAKYFKSIGAPVYQDKVKLPFPMFSLNKVKPAMDINSCNDKVDKSFDLWVKKFTGPYIITDKLDGMSALYYNEKLYKRGKGIDGQEITHLLPYINFGIDYKKLPKNIAIRGELIISKNNFIELTTLRDFKNARAAVSGIINNKTPNKQLIKYVDFVAYNIIFPIYKQSTQLQLLNKLNINITSSLKINGLSTDFLIKLLNERKEICKYDIDGLVINDNLKGRDIQLNKLESNKQNPSYAIAFKYLRNDQIINATVDDVEWNISRLGFIKPKIKIIPVQILGTTITYATAHNAKFIYENNINKGTIIELAKSGDVIPKIVKIIKSSKSPKMPDIEYEWNETEVDIKVIDTTDDQEIKQLTNTLKIIDVKYFSEGYVTKCFNNGITNLINLINLDIETYQEIFGNILGVKLHTNLINALENTTFVKLMAASNCFDRGIGLKKIELIYKHIPDIMINKYKLNDLKNQILKINGFSDTTTIIFLDGFKKFKIFFKELSNEQNIIDFSYLLEEKTEELNTNNIFENQKIVLTGFRDKDIENFIIDNGGTITTAVSTKTNLLIIKDNSDEIKESNKYKKAKLLNISIITLNKFKKQYNYNE